jgi:hypothetical protein
VAAPAETRTPNLHRARVAHQECGWKGGDSGGGHNVPADSTGSYTQTWTVFSSRVIVAERSSPSRVRLRRAKRALDRSGPLCPNTARKKRKNGDQGKQNLTTTGLLMEGDSAQNPSSCCVHLGQESGVRTDRFQLVFSQAKQLFLTEPAFSEKFPEDERELRVPVVVLAIELFTAFGQVMRTER